MVICIAIGDIVVFNGPFPAGCNDLSIFWNKTQKSLLPGEKVLGDLGYKSDRKIITRLDKKNSQHKYAIGCARDCHETLNARLKTWGALKNTFRHIDMIITIFFEVSQ